MIKMIAAVSQNGVIGAEGFLPWEGKYPEDMKFFRTMTKNSIIIMGRKTFESIGNRPLPNRRNIVISRSANTLDTNVMAEGVEVYKSVSEALDKCDGDYRDIWIIGGERIYEAGMEFADEIYLTMIPLQIEIENFKNVARFPWINPQKFFQYENIKISEALTVIKYNRL
jgi:dihydrofolate reductase